ncbi:MAG: esterase-like activity of phytase family protein [Phormidium sp. GEM2.Bin31]|nr:MAG: esterase-like activity of phytase family protein [Phormidium sp. GEM2.Bin31]
MQTDSLARGFTRRQPIYQRILQVALVCLLLTLSSCGLPRIQAEDRLFLPLSLELLDESVLPSQDIENTRIGGLSAITYDRQTGNYYALSDDRGFVSPARFYTLSIDIGGDDPDLFQIRKITIEDVTLLRDEAGELFPAGTIDPEGIALSPDRTLFIASEGVSQDGIPPFVDEFDLTSGRRLRALPIPDYMIPDAAGSEQTLGVQNNLGFESLTIGGVGTGEPYRVFAATESALLQDLPWLEEQRQQAPADNPVPLTTRLLHYVVVENRAQVVAEHLYPLDEPPSLLTVNNGLVELLSLDGANALRSAPGGYFLSLERTFGAEGFGAKLFQMAIASASDISTLTYLQGESKDFQPVQKQLLLNLNHLEGFRPDNLEGMTFGPRLPDGSQSLILVSDDNFRDNQVNQFVLLRLTSQR